MTDLENIGVQASKGTRRQHPKKSVEVLNFVGQAQRVEIPSEGAFLSAYYLFNIHNEWTVEIAPALNFFSSLRLRTLADNLSLELL